MTKEEEKIFSGKLFCPGDPELKELKRRSHELSAQYSRTPEDQTAERAELLRRMLGAFGEGSSITGPVFLHYGVHTRIGRRNFFNYNLTIQDDAAVTIGDDNNFGPNLTIVTPLHPMLAEERRCLYDENGTPAHLCYARPVAIGSNCWFGANVVVCPGVTIGDNCVIGAGSVVTRSIPAGVFAAGVPCRGIREITGADSMIHHPEILGDWRTRR